MVKETEMKVRMPEPTMSIIISKDQAKQVKAGENTKFVVKGTVEGISKIYDSDKWRVEIKGGSIDGIEVNKADRDLKEMAKVEVMNEADRGYRDSLEG